VLGADGRDYLWSSYLGGTADDRANGVAVADDGGVVVTGSTNSTNFPTARAFQAQPGGGRCPVLNEEAPCPDAFVTAFDADGQALAFSSYLGGSSLDTGRAVAIDGQGLVGVTGETESRNFPVLSAWKPRHGGAQLDGFLTLFAGPARGDPPPDPVGIAASTYLGGRQDTAGEALAVTATGSWLVGGKTGGGYPVVGAAQPEFGGGDADALVLELAQAAAPTATPDPPTVTPDPPSATPGATLSASPTSSPDAGGGSRLYLPSAARP
jgi:hypothetical protein